MIVETEEELCQLNIRCIPLKLRQQFKMFCSQREYVMERAVIELIKKALREKPDLPGAGGHYY